ncbi:Calcium/calmodulin-dependent protein kinase kinase 2 [Temnothorax longispinosus]|uniref:Calcium/calmodulin-dependent protein kinase kinase 2 n=1 Tax=Temnothorax longispinosus TaxID=300112 RepID=A0A4S2KPD0_9HYME|nr:Calcium/calmodulin-dependent protein kinase kinase 2 [Temnothorax longispinosus]
MPRKFSLQTTLRQRPTRISIGSHPYRRVALSIVRKKGESVNLVDYSQPIGVLGEEHSFFAERDFPARLVGRETKKEQSSCERLLPSSDIANNLSSTACKLDSPTDVKPNKMKIARFEVRKDDD